jgi:hypothetical protein
VIIRRGSPSSVPRSAHLVLEQLAQRLDQRQVHPLGQAADVVVALDHRRRAAHRHALDHVGVERALGEEPRAGDGLASSSNTVDELAADDLALALGVGDPGQGVEEAIVASTTRRSTWK